MERFENNDQRDETMTPLFKRNDVLAWIESLRPLSQIVETPESEE